MFIAYAINFNLFDNEDFIKHLNLEEFYGCFLHKEFQFYNDNEIWNVEYQINITDNNNYNSSNNPPFLHKDEDNKLYLNEGKIIFTFMLVNDIVNNKLKNPNQYWISYNNDNNIPL